MKIVAFSQVRNELKKGNLHNWFKCILSICDSIYMFDQASDDGSIEIYKEYGLKYPNKINIVLSKQNNFSNEIGCKSFLLKLLLEKEPDVDWVCWLDVDGVFTKKLLDYNEVRKMLSHHEKNVDSVRLGHYNNWRSDTYYRLDSEFNGLNGHVVSFWKNNGNLYFPNSGGLHQRVIPLGLTSNCLLSDGLPEWEGEGIIHKGFDTYQVLLKHDVYKARGQRGYALDRLLDEKTLDVAQIRQDLLPDWYQVRKNDNPIGRKPLIEIYQEIKNKFNNASIEDIDHLKVKEIISKYE